MTQFEVNNPMYPDFPTEEYVERIKKAQALMKEADVDLLLLSGKENVEYFSGFICGHWNVKGFSPAVFLLPQSGEPALLVPAFLKGTAKGSSWIAQLYTHDDTHAQPRDFPRLVVEVVQKLGQASGRIGVELGDELQPHLPLVDWEYVKANLPKAEITSAASIIWQLRMVKSPRELERMETLMGMTNRAIMATREQIRVGMTEADVAKILCRAIVDEGALPNFLNIRAGRYDMADSIPLDNKLQPGNMLVFDTGVVYKSYVSDVAYVGHVGEPSAKHREVYSIVNDALDAALAAIRPGASVAEVEQASLDVLRQLDYGRVLDMTGHGVGMDTHEPPVLSVDGTELLEEGMVLAVEPWFYDADGLGVFSIEEMVIVTKNGYKNLSTVPRKELWVIE